MVLVENPTPLPFSLNSTMNTASLPPSGQPLLISNKQRWDYTEDPFNFQVTFTNGAIAEIGQKMMLLVPISAGFQNLIPNINKYNNVLMYKYNNSSYTVVLSPGNYDVNTLMSTLNTEFALRNPALQLTYDTTLKVLTLTIPGGNTFTFVRPSVTSDPAQNQYTYQYSAVDRMLDQLGFMQYANRVLSGTVAAPDPINIFGTKWVDIVLNINLGCIQNGPLNRQVLGRVYMTEPYGSMVVWMPQNAMGYMVDLAQLDGCRLQLYDSWNNLIDTVPKNTPFSLKILLVDLGDN